MAAQTTNYIKQGTQEAAVARDLTDEDWNDVWKNYAAQYALAQQEFDYNREMWNFH